MVCRRLQMSLTWMRSQVQVLHRPPEGEGSHTTRALAFWYPERRMNLRPHEGGAGEVLPQVVKGAASANFKRVEYTYVLRERSGGLVPLRRKPQATTRRQVQVLHRPPGGEGSRSVRVLAS